MMLGQRSLSWVVSSINGRFQDHGQSSPRTSGVHDAKGMMLSETFQIAAIVEKRPPVWKDFKNYLKHKRKKMCIEQDNRGSKKKGTHNPNKAKTNFVEHG